MAMLDTTTQRWRYLDVTGPDAEDFLNRISTAAVKTLKKGQHSPACILNAQGRFMAAFELWRKDDQHFSIEYESPAPPFWNNDVAAVLNHFHFSEKLEIRPQPHPQKTEPSPAEEKARILALIPRLAYEITDEVHPLEVNWQSAVSQHKGCYPGQEVLERIFAKGEPARRLVLVTGQGQCPHRQKEIFTPSVPDQDQSPTGHITSSVVEGQSQSDEKKWWALALIKKNALQKNLPLIFSQGEKLHVQAIAPFK